MQLGELVAAIVEAETLNFRDAEVTSVVTDSRRATRGSVFCALVGERTNGNEFIGDAARHGAVAVITERAELTTPLTQLVVPDARAAMRKAAWALWERSARSLKLAGVTGTNGKTTTATLTRAMLDASGQKTGLITTMGKDTGNGPEPTGFTTPETAELLGAIHEMAGNGMSRAVIEVSSHSLSLGRVDGLNFTVAAFTNLTAEHLDFHKTLDNYLAAKALLFERLPESGFAVLNKEDPASAKISERTKATVVSTGITKDCDVYVRVDAPGQTSGAHAKRIELTYNGDSIAFEWSMAGRHNLLNLASAAGAALSAGASMQAVASAAQAFTGVPGRLESVPNDLGVRVLVDFAHTPDALENVLKSVKSDAPGRIICVFGCGGDRDRTKRPVMGRIAADLSDVAIVTSDNPRTEDAATIIEEVLAGIDDRKNVGVEVDRRDAIESAVGIAKESDTILIAGKGHETYQIVGNENLPFSDVGVAREALETRSSES